MFVIMISNYDITIVSKQFHLFNYNHQWTTQPIYLQNQHFPNWMCMEEKFSVRVCWSIISVDAHKGNQSKPKLLSECLQTKSACSNDIFTTAKVSMWGKFNAYILCLQHWITYASHGSVRTNSHHNSSCPTSNHNCSLTVKKNSYIGENRQN